MLVSFVGKGPSTLADFVESLKPVEDYDSKEQSKFFGLFGSQLAQMFLFIHSGDESHQQVVEAMGEAFPSCERLPHPRPLSRLLCLPTSPARPPTRPPARLPACLPPHSLRSCSGA